MIRKLWDKFVNRETISYFIFGVLTTAMDWGVFTLMKYNSINYKTATVGAWCAAVLFAFVTNKFFVFQSRSLSPAYLTREFFSFVTFRALSGGFTLAAMIVMVDYMALNDYVSKLIVSVIVLVLNYILSKIFIFRKKACKER